MNIKKPHNEDIEGKLDNLVITKYLIVSLFSHAANHSAHVRRPRMLPLQLSTRLLPRNSHKLAIPAY